MIPCFLSVVEVPSNQVVSLDSEKKAERGHAADLFAFGCRRDAEA
jgi:hypothetical protein